MRTLGPASDGRLTAGEAMQFPDRIEIEQRPESDSCFMFRYTRSGGFCGDTWHEDLEAAFNQANVAYGLGPTDFLLVHDDGIGGIDENVA